jgi:hypothetical protein
MKQGSLKAHQNSAGIGVSATALPFDHGAHSREIRESDIPVLAELLGRGLGYPSAYYLRVLDQLTERPVPSGLPRYGYLLESGTTIVGAILLIFTQVQLPNESTIRCHVTAWYVEPGYRAFAAIFFSKALKHKGVTYLNISARPSAFRFLELHGFSKYANGQFLAIPTLNAALGSSNQAKVAGVETIPIGYFKSVEQDLLLTHAKYGCLSLWCMTPERAYPFVFHARYFKGFIPGLQLIYCRDVEDFVRFAAPIGLFLAARGKFLVRIDSNGPIPGLFGRYFEGLEPRYYKGPKPRLGDLAYTQTVMAPSIRRKWHVLSRLDRTLT